MKTNVVQHVPRIIFKAFKVFKFVKFVHTKQKSAAKLFKDLNKLNNTLAIPTISKTNVNC